jgi:hypothetical protein
MNDDAVGQSADQLVRQAIGGSREARTLVAARAPATRDPALLVLAALLGEVPERSALLERAGAAASHRADRQLVAIARAHADGNRDLVDALARDHLSDFPGSYLVAWVASGAQVGGP